MKHIDILYCCSDTYATHAGISISSLLENNKDHSITIYFAGLDLSTTNRSLLEQTANNYNQKLVFLDVSDCNAYLKDLRCHIWNGSLATWLRFIVLNKIPDTVSLLLNIDSDTLVVDDISDISLIQMENYPVGAVCDSVCFYHRFDLGFSPDEAYYNGGILLFNMTLWRQGMLYDKMVNHLKQHINEYTFADQDLLNDFFHNKIMRLPQSYNLQGPLFLYRPEDYLAVYPWDKNSYYTVEESLKAVSHPKIIHFFRFLGDHPWNRGWNLHPCKTQYIAWKQLSFWKDFPLALAVHKPIFILEKILFICLPRRLFLRLFSWFTNKKKLNAY